MSHPWVSKKGRAVMLEDMADVANGRSSLDGAHDKVRLGSVFYLWLRKVSANERRRYKSLVPLYDQI